MNVNNAWFLKLELYPKGNEFYFASLSDVVGFKQRAGYVELQMAGGHKENINVGTTAEMDRIISVAILDSRRARHRGQGRDEQ